jgi:hypothetical protein
MTIRYGIDYFAYHRVGTKAYKFKYVWDYVDVAIYYCKSECIAHQVVIQLNHEHDVAGVENPWRFIGVSNT